MEDKNKEAEIDLLELGKKLWDNKKFIIKVTVIGAVIGLVIAFSIPKEYTSSVVFTTYSDDGKTGNMGALASLAGINLGSMQSTSDVFSPELYPDIIGSTPFIQGILDIKVQEEGISSTLYVYLKEKQKSPWWSYIFKAPKLFYHSLFSDKIEDEKKTSSSYFITDEEKGIIELLERSYLVSHEKKTGITSFNITTQSSAISAFLADTITSRLQDYIIEKRTKKATIDLINAEKLFEQSKKEYYTIQQKLASFVDANKNVVSAKYKVNQEKLQNETDLSYSLYTQMAQQVQANKIKVQDNTPVFTIIQPAYESTTPSKPPKKIILLIFIFLSFMGSSSWVLLKEKLSSEN